MYDIAIIGSGLGGLECGYLLAKKGYKVCVIEKETQPGGCLQTFKRSGCLFDTGFHYVGGLGEGQILNKLFRYFDLLDLPWHPMDPDGYDEVWMGDRSYLFASGYDRFTETLAKDFPRQYDNLKLYSRFFRKVGQSISGFFDQQSNTSEAFRQSLFTLSAYDFLYNIIDDPLLCKVLSGTSLKMELHTRKLPLYTFTQINDTYIQSAWRLKGGGSQIATSLCQSIRNMGGEVITGMKVTALNEREGEIVSATLGNKEKVFASRFISNIHPARTLELLRDSRLVRPIYRKRIHSLENTFGMFTVNLRLKENHIPYLNRNQYIHKQDDNLWMDHAHAPGRRRAGVMVNYYVPDADNPYARQMDLLTPMYWEEIKEWESTRVGHRGEEYNRLKEEMAEYCVNRASEHIPGLKNAIDKIHTHTPLTYRDYTGTPNGSAFGIRKDYNQPMYTFLSPRTPVSNLLLTGQNLSVHGILGVSMTALHTCAQIIGRDSLVNEFKEFD